MAFSGLHAIIILVLHEYLRCIWKNQSPTMLFDKLTYVCNYMGCSVGQFYVKLDVFSSDKGTVSTQLIDEDGGFNVTGLENFMKEVNFGACGLSYAVVSIMGPQSSGMYYLHTLSAFDLFHSLFVVDAKDLSCTYLGLLLPI